MTTTSPRGGPDAPFRITGPGELIQAVPYLLGFHPTRSLVLVGLRAGQLVVTARLDLDDLVPGAADAVPAVLVDTVAAMAQGGTTQVIGAVYDDSVVPAAVPDPLDLPWAAVVRALGTVCDGVDVAVLDVLLVCDQRLRSYHCCDPDCCPPEGRPGPRGPSEFVTAATYSGVVALPDRAALAATLDPLPDARRASLAPLLAAVRADRTPAPDSVVAAARAAERPRWRAPSDADAAALGSALRDLTTRDEVWSAVDCDGVDGRPLWRDLARRLPTPYDATPLFLFAWAAWRAGDGALAGIAAERAVASDPDCSAAELLLTALAHGVDPRRLPRLSRPA